MSKREKFPVDCFEKGETLLEEVAGSETTSDNLRNHRQGGLLVLGSISIGRAFGKVSQAYVDRGAELLDRSCDALAKYVAFTGDSMGYSSLEIQCERLGKLRGMQN